MSTELFFSLLYILIAICLIYPPVEFVSAGFTISNIFSTLLGYENEDFIKYHINRSAVTLLVYSFIPLGYITGLSLFTQNAGVIYVLSFNNSLLWQLFTTTALVLPLLAFYQIRTWLSDDYVEHPIVKNISKFCNNNSDWKTVARDINIEYRRIDKICIQTNAINKIIATENWILIVTPLTIFFAHQSDASLVVNKSDTHNISHSNIGEVQYINIEVQSRRDNVESFTLRLNSVDFNDLEDRVARTIAVLPNVKFHKSLIDKFVDAFKDAIQNNPLYVTEQEREHCIGCMQIISNVKLQKVCLDEPSTSNCTNCYCRPMWCVDCMAKWFATRQDNEQPGTWLSSKCTCPMCRATFCILDVCLIQELT